MTIGRRELPLFAALERRQGQQLGQTVLPLPSARLQLDDGPLKTLYDEVLACEGIELAGNPREVPARRVLLQGRAAGHLSAGRAVARSRHGRACIRGRQKLTLRFTLPRGSLCDDPGQAGERSGNRQRTYRSLKLKRSIASCFACALRFSLDACHAEHPLGPPPLHAHPAGEEREDRRQADHAQAPQRRLAPRELVGQLQAVVADQQPVRPRT